MTSQLVTTIPTAIVMDEHYALAIMPEAEESVRSLIRVTGRISTVDTLNAPTAKAYLAALGNIERDTEKTRVELKSRPLEIGRKIDNCAKSFLAPVVAERARLKSLIETHANEVAAAALAAQQEQARLAREAEAERQRQAAAELARLAAIAKAQADAEAAANAARMAQEAADAPDAGIAADIAAAAAYDAAADARTAQAEIARQNAAAAAQERANAALAASESERARVAASQKVAGTSQYWDYEVTNMRSLIQYSEDSGMDFVTMEVRRAEILAALKAFPIDGNPPVIPGLLVIRKVRVR